ncbi:glutathione S-transferase family protein [Pannus brasiliensis CCIBt3594]|uniref:Glutathione S-transferase family protein n=1 Tax=Pannus brasiliensis CCIBt3594 TaxID=1427578 RepID=A0AAW9QQE9_9CHRO
MRLLQFSTSHYCRKARLALGYKGIEYRVENLTPGLHALKLKPLTGGLTTLPVLLPEESGQPEVVADSTRILRYLEKYAPDRSFVPEAESDRRQAWLLEDWLDESIGVATRFVYYDYRAGEGKSIDPSLSSQLVINVVRRQYKITPATVKLASERLENALFILSIWKERPYLVGNSLSVADIAASGLLSPLALLPRYRQNYPWLFDKIEEIHRQCREPLPPGF